MLNKPPTCQGCISYERNQGFAPGEGPTSAKIMFIGEALGETEANEGRPFRGGTGKMLRMMIHQAGLEPHEYFITNVVKCRPPGNATPTAVEIFNCTERYLWKELKSVLPSVIVPVGDVAFRTILPDVSSGVTTVRGYTFDRKGTMVIPIVHPSFVARGNREYWAITVADLKKIRLAAQGIVTPAPKECFSLFPSIQDVRGICDMILRKNLRFSFDLETVGEKEKLNIMVCGFAWSDEHAICVPFLKKGGHLYWENPEHEVEAWEWLMKLMYSDNIKVGQNIFTFDMPILMDHKVPLKRHTFRDTLIRHHCIGLELPHSLAFLTSIYTSIPFYKMDVKKAGGMLWADDEIMRRYNCRDCIATYTADRILTQEMVDFGILTDKEIA